MKNTPTKKTTAAPKATKPQPVPALAATDNSQVAPAAAVNDFQLMLADLCGDLILNGGAADDVDRFLGALVRHEWNRANPGAASAIPPNVWEHRIGDWRQSLIEGWLKGRPMAEATAASEALIDLMRANNRWRLQVQFEGFLEKASPEEVFLLLEVLGYYNSSSYSNQDSEHFSQRTALLDSFADTVGVADQFVPSSTRTRRNRQGTGRAPHEGQQAGRIGHTGAKGNHQGPPENHGGPVEERSRPFLPTGSTPPSGSSTRCSLPKGCDSSGLPRPSATARARWITTSPKWRNLV